MRKLWLLLLGTLTLLLANSSDVPTITMIVSPRSMSLEMTVYGTPLAYSSALISVKGARTIMTMSTELGIVGAETSVTISLGAPVDVTLATVACSPMTVGYYTTYDYYYWYTTTYNSTMTVEYACSVPSDVYTLEVTLLSGQNKTVINSFTLSFPLNTNATSTEFSMMNSMIQGSFTMYYTWIPGTEVTVTTSTLTTLTSTLLEIVTATTTLTNTTSVIEMTTIVNTITRLSVPASALLAPVAMFVRRLVRK